MADKSIFRDFKPNSNNVQKSTFDKSFINNLTARIGRAIPVFVEEAPANSAYSIDTDFAFDFQSLWYPVQNNITAHLSYFRVPMRLLMKNFKRFQTQIGRDGKINGSTSYTMPYIKRSPGWCKQGSLADYMGLPTNYYSDVERTRVIDGVNDVYVLISHRSSSLTRQFFDFLSSAPVASGAEYTNGIGIGFQNYSPLSESSKIYIDFFTSEFDENGVEITDRYIASILSSVNLVCNVSCGHFPSVRNRSNPVDLADGTPLTIDITSSAASYSISENRTFVYNGVSLKSFTLAVSLSSEFINDYNSRSYYDDGHHITLQFVDDSSGMVTYSYLYKRSSGLPAISADASLSGLVENKDVENDIILRPSLDKFGMYCVRADVMEIVDGGQHHFSSLDGEADPVIPINALPFRAYEYIHNYFYRNSRVDPFFKVSPETGVMQECYDEFITNDGDGADSTTPVDFFNVPWEYDMFTTCVKEPFYGDAPLVGINYQPDGFSDYTTATFTMRDSDNNQYSFDARVNSNGQLISMEYSDTHNTPNKPLFDALNYAIRCGISINDFRNASALQRFQEKYMKAGSARYADIVEEFFGVRPALGEEHPTYLGGVSRRVMVNKITNTAQSDGNPLGDFAGTASVHGKAKRIKVFCKEPCYIMGILYFSVTPLYSQMLPKHFIKYQLLDYYNPIFANIAPQPVYKKQLAPLQLSTSEVDEVFGYNRPYADYVSRQDEVHGDFRGNMADFLFQRLFKDKPRLNSSFINIDSADLTNIFSSIEDNDKIFGQIAFGVRAKLPIPRYSTPHIL